MLEMKWMKLTVIGGGGVRALMLAKSLALQGKDLGIDEIVFMDNDPEKLRIFGGMAGEVIRRLGGDFTYSYTNDPRHALAGADYVITTIRVGGDAARVADERIAISHGLIGQETTGAGGFAMAMRSIPALAEYCALIRDVASPHVMVFNFTNPAGLVTQAMRDLGYDFVYGICDAPSGLLRQIARLLEVSPQEMTMDVLGLNHLSYFGNITCRGEDVTAALLSNPRLYTETDMRYFQPELPQKMGLLLNEYLYYYYYRKQAVEHLQNVKQTRGESILSINREMLSALRGMDPVRDFDKMLQIYSDCNHRRELSYMAGETGIARNREAAPLYDIYQPDDGGYAGVAMAFVRARQLEMESQMVLCLPNGNTVDWLEPTDVIETTCYIGPEGATPKKAQMELPSSAKHLISSVKLYERLAAQAILHRDKALAREALTVHPLVNSYSLAQSLLEEYLSAHAPWVGEWK